MRQTIHQFQPRQFYRLTIVFMTLISFNSNLFGQSKSDTVLIKETVLNYLEGLEYNDTLRVEKALYPDLAKRVIKKDKNGNEKLENMTAQSLLHYTKTFDYTKNGMESQPIGMGESPRCISDFSDVL